MKVITSVTPMSRTIGNGKPAGMCQPPSGAGPQFCSAAMRFARPVGQKLLLANQASPSATPQPTTPSRTSAHMGRMGKPYRRR